MDRKYFEAYDDRYRQVHGENLRWFDSAPSAIVGEILSEFRIPKTAKVLEIGCGEGRDARFLLENGYDLLATDISSEAVSFCRKENPRFSDCFQVLDCTKDTLETRFDVIYAVAVIHMLVLDEDRDAFYSFVRSHLTENGIALICTMGDGKMERSSDISNAFELQERIHEPTGKTVYIAGTSYRGVSFESFDRELDRNGLEILKQGFTDVKPDYWKMMYAVVKKKNSL